LPRHTAFKIAAKETVLTCSFTKTGDLITVELNAKGKEGVYARFYTTGKAMLGREAPAPATIVALGKKFAENCGNPLEAFQKAVAELKQRFDLGKK